MEGDKSENDAKELKSNDQVIDVEESQLLLEDEYNPNDNEMPKSGKRNKIILKNNRRKERGFKRIPNFAKNAALKIHEKMKVSMKMVEIQRESSGINIKMLILIWLTFQNSAHNLLIRYSRAREVDDMFLATSAVFNTEIVKIIICLYMVVYETGSINSMIRQINSQVIKQPFDTLKVCIPAMIYIVQNNLFYLAASHLDAASFMITSQLKIFTTALFSVILLRKSLLKTQWFALLILFLGVSLVQMQTGKTGVIDPDQKPFIGLLAVISACCLSGFAGVYFEKILKGSAPVSIWIRNVQMAIFAIPASFLGMYMQDGKVIMEKGIYFGYDFVVWLTVFWYGVGGLSVAVCIKYADNIAKNFATSVSIILSTIGSMYLFSFIPNALFSLGASLVIFSIFLYSSSNTFVKFLKKQTIV
uniref:Uncharacterized protein n=1 Tax=Parastrongyloides trichosuri TaxID=131310 RepID=A0A0N5A3N9_PARTI